MNTKLVIVLFCMMTVSLCGQGSTVVTCANSCDDTNCGKAGTVTNNWAASVGGCIVNECSSLTTTVTTKACTSCYSKDTLAKMYANTASTACVTVDCAKIASNKGFTWVLCGECFQPNSEPNDDASGCVAISNSKILAASILFLIAFLI